MWLVEFTLALEFTFSSQLNIGNKSVIAVNEKP